MIDIEFSLINGLFYDSTYFNTVIHHIKPAYFDEDCRKYIVSGIVAYNKKYDKCPTIDELLVDLEEKNIPSDSVWADILAELDKHRKEVEQRTDWLIEKAEKFCRDRAFYLVFKKGLDLIDEDEDDVKRKNSITKSEIPDLMQKALSIRFDNDFGTELGDDSDIENQIGYYTGEQTDKIPFLIPVLNEITNDGLPESCLVVFMSSKTGGFKSGSMCSLAVDYFKQGKNVLYFSLELSEKYLRERLDANLLETDIDDLRKVDPDEYRRKVRAIRGKYKGRIIVKEYPTKSAHVGHFRHAINELRQSKDFVPDVIIVDYLNICLSLRESRKSGSYQYLKSIAEELRGLSGEFKAPVITATQSGRTLVKNPMDMDVDNVSESYGISETCDLMLGIISIPELLEQNVLLFKQLKNRIRDEAYRTIFPLSVNKAQMRLTKSEYNMGSETEMPERNHKEEKPTGKKGNGYMDWEI